MLLNCGVAEDSCENKVVQASACVLACFVPGGEGALPVEAGEEIGKSTRLNSSHTLASRMPSSA